MSETTKPYNEIDDHIAAFSDEERQEYVAADTALDLACMLSQIRQEQGLTQRQAAERTGGGQRIADFEQAFDSSSQEQENLPRMPNGEA